MDVRIKKRPQTFAEMGESLTKLRIQYDELEEHFDRLRNKYSDLKDTVKPLVDENKATKVLLKEQKKQLRRKIRI